MSVIKAWPWDPLVDMVLKPIGEAVGWAWDSVIAGITDWVARGFVELLDFVWSVMDRSSTPHVRSGWFMSGEGAPYTVAVGVAGLLLVIFLLCGVIQGVMAGRPGELVRRALRDTPIAVAGILFTVGFAQVGIDLIDALCDGIWAQTRPRALQAFDAIGMVAIHMSPNSILGTVVLLAGMLALLALWAVLLIRDSLIFVLVALSPLAFAASVWPQIASARRRCLEVLAGLIVSKLAIAIALTVGIGALGGVGATGTPGAGTVDNGLAEFSTIVVGIVTFAVAAFMPFVVMRLLPVIEAAVVSQGVSSAAIRAGQTGVQYGRMTQASSQRLASGTSGASGFAAEGASAGVSAGVAMASRPIGAATGYVEEAV